MLGSASISSVMLLVHLVQPFIFVVLQHACWSVCHL